MEHAVHLDQQKVDGASNAVTVIRDGSVNLFFTTKAAWELDNATDNLSAPDECISFPGSRQETFLCFWGQHCRIERCEEYKN